MGVVRAPGGGSSARRQQQQQQQLNEADAEEVAVNAAPHLSGVAAPRTAPLPGERRALVGLSRQEGETGGGPEVEFHVWTRVLPSHRGLYFLSPKRTHPPSSFGERTGSVE